jgi:hypothetical protein
MVSKIVRHPSNSIENRFSADNGRRFRPNGAGQLKEALAFDAPRA